MSYCTNNVCVFNHLIKYLQTHQVNNLYYNTSMDAWMGPNHEMCVLCVYVIIVYESNNVQLVLMTTSECMNQVFV